MALVGICVIRVYKTHASPLYALGVDEKWAGWDRVSRGAVAATLVHLYGILLAADMPMGNALVRGLSTAKEEASYILVA